MTSFISFIGIFADYCARHPFLSGICAGLILVLLLDILLSIIRLCFLPKRIKEISYDAEGGKISIRAAAVADLISSVGMEFSELSIVKTVILKKHGKPVLHVVLDYEIGGRTFQSAASDFQKRAADAIRETFGISDIKEIEVSMRNTIGDSASHSSSENKDEETDNRNEPEDIFPHHTDLNQF